MASLNYFDSNSILGKLCIDVSPLRISLQVLSILNNKYFVNVRISLGPVVQVFNVSRNIFGRKETAPFIIRYFNGTVGYAFSEHQEIYPFLMYRVCEGYEELPCWKALLSDGNEI